MTRRGKTESRRSGLLSGLNRREGRVMRWTGETLWMSNIQQIGLASQLPHGGDFERVFRWGGTESRWLILTQLQDASKQQKWLISTSINHDLLFPKLRCLLHPATNVCGFFQSARAPVLKPCCTTRSQLHNNTIHFRPANQWKLDSQVSRHGVGAAVPILCL